MSTSHRHAVDAMLTLLSRSTPRRYRRVLSIILTFISIAALITILQHERAKERYISEGLAAYSPHFALGERAKLSRDDAQYICHEHGFPLFKEDGKPRKVYDLVLINTELDWLEIRLHSMSAYVDYFVVVEASTTFTGRPKPLHLQENWDRFKDFHHKIIHRVVHDPITSSRIWDHEDWIRDAMFTEVFPNLEGSEVQAEYGDALIVSDIDEVLRPGTMLLLRYCDFPARLIMRTDFFYYSYQWRHRGPQWHHPDATTFQGIATITPNRLRQGLLGPGFYPYAAFRRWWDRITLLNAGWHCSSCFETVAEMQTKMGSFAHAGLNTEQNRDPRVMMERVRNGEDLFGRPKELYDRVEGNTDLPAYILKQYERHGRFKHMINRDGADAGFVDGLEAVKAAQAIDGS